jgi:hypothetical protein
LVCSPTNYLLESPLNSERRNILVEPITNGTITGSLTGTINGGLAHVNLLGGNVWQTPLIGAHGKTSDGLGFFIRQVGTGSASRHFTYLVRLHPTDYTY